MSRESADRYVGGALVDGFDYDLQVWVIGGRIVNVGQGAKDNPAWVGRRVFDVRLEELNLSPEDTAEELEARQVAEAADRLEELEADERRMERRESRPNNGGRVDG